MHLSAPPERGSRPDGFSVRAGFLSLSVLQRARASLPRFTESVALAQHAGLRQPVVRLPPSGLRIRLPPMQLVTMARARLRYRAGICLRERDLQRPRSRPTSGRIKGAAVRHFAKSHVTHGLGTVAAQLVPEPVTKEAAVLGRLGVILTLLILPSAAVNAQPSFARRLATCRCEPDGKPRKPRFLLPLAGGLGFIPISVAARDSQLPTVALPSLVDIRDDTPRNALEGERELAAGALAPDTATALPTVMVVAVVVFLAGVSLSLPRRKRRRRESWRGGGARVRGGWRLRSMHRRRVGGVLAAGGGVLLLLGSREYAEGARAQRQARAEWLRVGQTVVRISDRDPEPTRPAQTEQDVASPLVRAVAAARGGASRSLPSVVPLPVLAMSGREIRRGSPVARLLIPAIDLDEIVMEGVGPVELNGGPGHFPGSVLPGDAGNSIVSAHRDRHFRRMGELAVGSHLRTESRTGATDWVITERRVVSRDTPALFEESEPTLTLTTCWPLRYFGPAPDRLLIIAKPVNR